MLALSLAACGADDSAPDPGDTSISDSVATDSVEIFDTVDTGIDRDTLIRPETDAPLDASALDAPPGEWTWFPQPGSACSDGSETGFAVNRGASDDLLVFFMGGGACWDFQTCFLFQTATTGPFTGAQLDALAPELARGIFDRADPTNPYRDFTHVFIPYCTGDLHAGERAVAYTEGGLTRTWHHMGALNLRLALPRLSATFPSPPRLVVTGSSAGGYGATFQYAALREAFTAATTQLVIDSGPLLVGDAIPVAHRTAWFANWRLDLVVDPICGQLCKDDLSHFYPALAQRFDTDRMALISSHGDDVIATYFLMTSPQFEAALSQLVGDVLAPLPRFGTFLFAGTSHTTLLELTRVDTDGTTLASWLALMLGDDPSWTSTSR